VATLLHNITTTLTQDLLAAGDGVNNIKSITIANVEDSNDAVVSLFLNKKQSNFYILKSVLIPNGSSLALNEEDNIAFNNGVNGFSLRIQSTENVDVIIKR
tara:strand:+ start:1335 stop:1637 length:303 start_codon:yes stop_codon:yes gene_type:complete